MNMLPDEDFLAWFFTYFTGDITCPHCNEEIFRGALEEAFDGEVIVCPHCGEEIRKDDLE